MSTKKGARRNKKKKCITYNSCWCFISYSNSESYTEYLSLGFQDVFIFYMRGLLILENIHVPSSLLPSSSRFCFSGSPEHFWSLKFYEMLGRYIFSSSTTLGVLWLPLLAFLIFIFPVSLSHSLLHLTTFLSVFRSFFFPHDFRLVLFLVLLFLCTCPNRLNLLHLMILFMFGALYKFPIL